MIVFSLTKYRSKWYANFEVIGGRAVGDLYISQGEYSTHEKRFDVKIAEDNTFSVSIGSSGLKLRFRVEE